MTRWRRPTRPGSSGSSPSAPTWPRRGPRSRRPGVRRGVGHRRRAPPRRQGRLGGHRGAAGRSRGRGRGGVRARLPLRPLAPRRCSVRPSRPRSPWPTLTSSPWWSTPARPGTTRSPSSPPRACRSARSSTASPAARRGPAVPRSGCAPVVQRHRHLQGRPRGARGGRAVPARPVAGRDRLALPRPGAPPRTTQPTGVRGGGRRGDRVRS